MTNIKLQQKPFRFPKYMKEFFYSFRFATYYLVLFAVSISAAQEKKTQHDLSLGVGIGLDHGGIGLKTSAVKFSSQFELTFGIGYNLNFIGLSGGLLARTPPTNSVAAFISAMYGYVGVIENKNSGFAYSQFEAKTYYGPSFGTGIEIRGPKRKNYFKLGLIIPIRPSSFKDDIIKYNADKPWDVLPSLGYHIVL